MNNIDEIKEKYELSDEEFQEMYEQARKLIIRDCKPSKGIPTAIVTGGQPGAGKIGLVLKSKRDLSKIGEDVVIIDGDAYRGLYKNSMEIARNYSELYSEITDKATGRITKLLLKEVMDEGYNFIFEGTMGKINIIKSLQSAPVKFNVIARLIATSREESLLSVFERYLVMKQNMGMGRFATIKAHDSRFESFTEISKELEGIGVEVEVYERSESYENIGNPILLYKTSSKENKCRSVEEAMTEGRERSFEKCKGNINARLNAINADFENLNENNPKFREELEELNKILSERVNETEREVKRTMEILNLYNARKEKINKTLIRNEKEPEKGEYKQSVHVWLVNDNNEILIQKRSFKMNKNPGKWAFTGGVPFGGENSIQGAMREVKEELGIKLKQDEMELLISFRREHDFVDVWVARNNTKINEIKLQEDEVEEAKWADINTIENMVKEGEFVKSVSLYFELFKRLMEKDYFVE